MFFIFLMMGAPQGSRHFFFIITAVITGVAGFFYFTMATGATSTNIGGRIPSPAGTSTG